VDPFGLCGERTWWEKLERGYYFGTGYGEDALGFYTRKWSETGNWWWGFPGGVAALWTPENYWKTAGVLASGWSVAGWAAKTGPWIGTVQIHPAHHSFPFIGQQPHIQIIVRNFFRVLIKTKNFNVRIPVKFW